MNIRQIRPSRGSHTGKSEAEKNQYKQSLKRPSKEADDTLDVNKEKPDFVETDDNEHSLKNIKGLDGFKKTNHKKESYKSFWTKIKEFSRKIGPAVYIIVILGVAGVCLTTVWNQNRELGEISANLKTLQADVDTVQSKYDKVSDGKINEDIITTEINKDLEFIKLRLDKIEKKLKM